MPGPTPYQYKPDDDPVTVAQANGITPEQLIQANPGGYPFSAGQNINIPMLPPLVQNNINQRGRGYGGPYQYGTTAAPSLLQQRIDQGQQQGQLLTTRPQSRLGANYGPGYQMQPSINPPPSSTYGTDDSWYRPATPVVTTPTSPTGNQNSGGPDNTDFANTAAARYNAANNIPFLQQSRWDPKRRKYISVGQWLRQNRRGGRGRGGGGKKPPEQKQQEFTLTNSFLDFNISAG
jgi:hypothetical protein